MTRRQPVPGSIDEGRESAWQSLRALTDASPTVVDEAEHWDAFTAALDDQVIEPDTLALFRSYVRYATVEHPLEHWIPKFRQLGFRATFGTHTVMTEPPAHPFVLWRLAEDWKAGMSWAADPRLCHSVPLSKGAIDTVHLWCAVVEPTDLLGIAWYSLGVDYGRPVWRTVDTDVFGRVCVAVDDFGEFLVDPTALADDRVVKWDSFSRPSPERKRTGKPVGLNHIAAAALG